MTSHEDTLLTFTLFGSRYGHFSGINRKMQLKSLNDKRNIDMKRKFKGRNTNSEPHYDDCKNPTLLLILKWGGELTPMGKSQAEELGRAFRCMYPGGQGNYLLWLFCFQLFGIPSFSLCLFCPTFSIVYFCYFYKLLLL